MRQDYRHALMLAIERGLFTFDETAGAYAVYNAVALPEITPALKASLICEQGFRPDFLTLEKSNYESVPQFVDVAAANAIVFAGRNRLINERNIARAWNQCEQGGQIIVAGDKTSGIASLRKWTANQTPIIDSFSKHHAVIFWIEKTGQDWELSNLQTSIEGYRIAEGMFSSDGPDEGSQLLVEHFDNRIGGQIADFGAGWGYLSSQLLARCDRVTSLELYEADWQSLEAAKENLSSTKIETQFHWCDLTSEYKKHVLDWVIMNPPFHIGRAAEPGLGQRFIQTAASTLPSGGRLLMVANKNLPYEQTLEKSFKAYQILEVRDGFKVIEARK